MNEALKKPQGATGFLAITQKVDGTFFKSEFAFYSQSVTLLANRRTSDWFLDSGASQHMSDQRDFFLTYQPVNPSKWPVHGIDPNNELLRAAGVGDVGIRARVDNVWCDGIIKNVLYVPHLGANLFSAGAAADNGYEIRLNATQAQIMRDKKVFTVYHLDVLPVQLPKSFSWPVAAVSITQPFNIWHRRLVHVNEEAMNKLKDGDLAEGVSFSKRVHTGPCSGCKFGKSHRLSFPKIGRQRGTLIDALIHSDVCGPMTPSPGGAQYYVLFKDDFSGFCLVYFMKQKSEVPRHFATFMHFLRSDTGQKVKVLCSDNGG